MPWSLLLRRLKEGPNDCDSVHPSSLVTFVAAVTEGSRADDLTHTWAHSPGGEVSTWW